MNRRSFITGLLATSCASALIPGLRTSEKAPYDVTVTIEGLPINSSAFDEYEKHVLKQIAEALKIPMEVIYD